MRMVMLKLMVVQVLMLLMAKLVVLIKLLLRLQLILITIIKNIIHSLINTASFIVTSIIINLSRKALGFATHREVGAQGSSWQD